MAENRLQVGTRVFVILPVEVLTLNESLHRRVVSTRRGTLQGVVVGVPDEHRCPAVAGITTVTEKNGTEILDFPNYTVELDRKQGKSTRLVIVDPDQLQPV
ncbi:MAG: hypothetical protein WDZ40_03855 [Candidatus Spechtbacterales bacterium]